MGTTLRTLIEAAGGVRKGHTLKAVIPGGTSTRRSGQAPRPGSRF